MYGENDVCICSHTAKEHWNYQGFCSRYVGKMYVDASGHNQIDDCDCHRFRKQEVRDINGNSIFKF